MGKRHLAVLILVLLTLTACSISKTDEKKIRDIEKGYLYIARGYGVKKTSGYSVNVSRCYETEQRVHINTSLLGPGKEEKILKKKTYPYVVVKMEYTDKPIEFD